MLVAESEAEVGPGATLTGLIGAILAAALAGLVLDVLPLGENAWRWLFAIGGLPALLILWVRRGVAEPELWRATHRDEKTRINPYRVLFGSELRRRTILAFANGCSYRVRLEAWLASAAAADDCGAVTVTPPGFVILIKNG